MVILENFSFLKDSVFVSRWHYFGDNYWSTPAFFWFIHCFCVIAVVKLLKLSLEEDERGEKRKGSDIDVILGS